jgi:hypothetical protein
MWRTKRPISEGSFLLKEREQPFYEFHVAYSFTGLYRRQSRSNGAHTARFGHPRAISVTIFAHSAEERQKLLIPLVDRSCSAPRLIATLLRFRPSFPFKDSRFSPHSGYHRRPLRVKCLFQC